MNRKAEIERNTNETSIRLEITLDGSGKSDIDTGIGFFDHMLDGFARHGLYDLEVKAEGDLFVDDHHMIEAMFKAFAKSLREAVSFDERIEDVLSTKGSL